MRNGIYCAGCNTEYEANEIRDPSRCPGCGRRTGVATSEASTYLLKALERFTECQIPEDESRLWAVQRLAESAVNKARRETNPEGRTLKDTLDELTQLAENVSYWSDRLARDPMDPIVVDKAKNAMRELRAFLNDE